LHAHKNGLADVVNRRPVEQLDQNGKFISEYRSLHEAARATNTHAGNIRHVLSGFLKSTGGFKWRYKEIKISYAFGFIR
jgi:hypothetical protein